MHNLAIALSEAGLSANLTSLSAIDNGFVLGSAADASLLRKSLPALRHARVTVEGTPLDAAATLRALGCFHVGTVALHLPPVPQHPLPPEDEGNGGDAPVWPSFLGFASGAAEALRLCHPTAVEFVPPFDDGVECSTPADRAAAADMAAALADPVHGPREIRGREWAGLRSPPGALCSLPGLSQICAALTPASPLRDLRLCGNTGWKGTGAPAEEGTATLGDAMQPQPPAAVVAAALAPGRSRISFLSVADMDLTVRGGCARTHARSLLLLSSESSFAARGVALLPPLSPRGVSCSVFAARHLCSLSLFPAPLPPSHFPPRSGVALFEALAGNRSLTRLELERCILADAECTALASTLRNNSCAAGGGKGGGGGGGGLLSLEIRSELRTSPGFDAPLLLFEALACGGSGGFCSLEHLVIDSGEMDQTQQQARFTAAAARALGAAIRRGAALRRLRLARSNHNHPHPPAHNGDANAQQQPPPASQDAAQAQQQPALAAAAMEAPPQLSFTSEDAVAPKAQAGDVFAAEISGALLSLGHAGQLRDVSLSGLGVGDAGANRLQSTGGGGGGLRFLALCRPPARPVRTYFSHSVRICACRRRRRR